MGGTSNMLNHLKLKHWSDISGWFIYNSISVMVVNLQILLQMAIFQA
jgi:hypothetical protein